MKSIKSLGWTFFTLVLIIRLDLCFASDAAFLGEQGAEALKNGNYDSAIENFSRAIVSSTNYSYAYYSRGVAYEKEHQHENAINDFTKAIRFDSRGDISGYAFGMRGDAYFEKNELDKAISDYSKAIQINSNLPANYVSRGSTYNLVGQFDLAKNDFNEAIKLDSNNATAYLGKGDAEREASEYDQAITDYDNAIQIAPTNALAYWARATAYTATENYSKAIADYDKMIQFNPTNVQLLAVRGMLFSKMGRFDKGIEDCKKAIALDSNSMVVNNNLAWLLSIAPDAKLRNGSEAVEYAKKACALTNWKDAYCLGTLAAAYAETGNFDKAVMWQKNSIELGLSQSDLKDAQNLLDLYKHNMPYHMEPLQTK